MSEQTFFGHVGTVEVVRFLNNGRKVVSAGQDGLIRIWSVISGESVDVLFGPQSPVLTVAVSADERFLVAGHENSETVVWDLDLNKISFRVLKPGAFPVSMEFSTDSRFVFILFSDGSLDYLERGSHFLHPFVSSRECEGGLAVSSDGRRMATGSEGNLVKIWDIPSRQCLQILKGHTSGTNGLAFSPDGSLIGSVGLDGNVKVWNVYSGESVRNLYNGDNWLNSIAFNVDGDQIVTTGTDKKVQLWDVSLGELFHSYSGHTEWTTFASFAPNDTVVSADEAGIIKVWHALV